MQSVIMGDSRLWERPLDRDFRDNMIASGNDDLDARVAILKENGNFKNVDTAMPVESLDDLEQYRSDRLTDKVTSLKDSLDAQYNSPSSRGRNTKASSGLPTLNNSASDRTNFGYSDSVNGIVTGNPWNFD